MRQLNLPSFEFKIREVDGKPAIFDLLRKKYIILTPEEWVRQHFVNLLITHYNYPRSLIKIESGHKYNHLQKRSDIIVYDRYGKIFLLVECKSADTELSQKVFEQAAQYNLTLNARHIAITNGLDHFVCAVDYENKGYKFLKDLPSFDLIQ